MTANRSESEETGLVAEARSMAASPALYVGAVTVVVANEVVEWLPLSDTAAALALFPIALALLYGQLLVVAALGHRGYGRWCA